MKRDYYELAKQAILKYELNPYEDLPAPWLVEHNFNGDPSYPYAQFTTTAIACCQTEKTANVVTALLNRMSNHEMATEEDPWYLENYSYKYCNYVSSYINHKSREEAAMQG